MTGLGYIILELVKLSVVLIFRFAPVDAKDMFTSVEVSKLFIVIFTVYVMGNGSGEPEQNKYEDTSSQVVIEEVVK